MNIAVHIPFHSWVVTRGGKRAHSMISSPQLWVGRAVICRDRTLKSLSAQTDQNFSIILSFRQHDSQGSLNPVVDVCRQHPGNQIIQLVRPYQEWQYHIAPNQADSFCENFGGKDEWLAILTMDSDDCYRRTVVEQIREIEPRDGLCCWFSHGYLYGIADGKMAWFGSTVGPPPFFCKFYPPAALASPEAFNAYRREWGLNCYHHELSRRKVHHQMPDNNILQTIHGANATTGWNDPHTTKHIKEWVTLIAEKAKILESFGVADNA